MTTTRVITTEKITSFARYLKSEERANGTIEKYLRDVNAFATWMDGRSVTKELAALWKEHILTDHAPGTVNSIWRQLMLFSAIMVGMTAV